MASDRQAAPRRHTPPKKPPKKKPLGKPPKRPPHKRLPRKPPRYPPLRPGRKVVGDLTRWLDANPAFANTIKWQFRRADPASTYVPPAETDKVAWPGWSANQKLQLAVAYEDIVDWFAGGAPGVAANSANLTDAPVNLHGNVGDDTVTVMENLAPDYLWDLYVAHVAFALAVELRGRVPWTIRNDSALAFRYLFDSTTMAWDLGPYGFGLGTYAAYVPARRVDNRPKTAFAPPKWTWGFLVRSQLIGATRLETVGRVLEWMRRNLAHFNGADTFGRCDEIWQYRGYPPLSRVTGGTVDAADPGHVTRCWTLGCHGSVGFLHAVLRIVNIPVQPVWIAGHELAYFVTEGRYLDHGDDPYNLVVRSSTAPVLGLLIDEGTYRARFTQDLAANIVDVTDPAVANVGLAAAQFPP